MILGAFGDSFLFGSDLSDCVDYYDKKYNINFRPNYPSNLTYTAITARNLKAEYLCTAYPGIGNTIIYDDVCRIISSYGNKVFYYINWTYSDRFDYINKDNNQWNTVRPSLDNPELDKFFYKHLHCELTDKLSTLTYMSNTISILEENNCKFCMSTMDNLIFDSEWHCPASVRLLQQKVKPYIFDFDGFDFLSWAKINNYPISEKNHPLEEAHKNAAILLKQQIEKICV